MCRKHSRKKVVATANRRESACKRTGEPSVPFCEKMRQDKRLKNYSAARRNRVPAKPNRFCGMKEEQAKLVPTWSGRQDSNLRPLGPKPSALPNCATPRQLIYYNLLCCKSQAFFPLFILFLYYSFLKLS